MSHGQEQVTRLRTISKTVMSGEQITIARTEDTTINQLFSAILVECAGNSALFDRDVEHNHSLLEWASHFDDAEIAYLLFRRRLRA